MKHVELYPPGGGDPVLVHAGSVERMKNRGWTEKSVRKSTKPRKEVIEHGDV